MENLARLAVKIAPLVAALCACAPPATVPQPVTVTLPQPLNCTDIILQKENWSPEQTQFLYSECAIATSDAISSTQALIGIANSQFIDSSLKNKFLDPVQLVNKQPENVQFTFYRVKTDTIDGGEETGWITTRCKEALQGKNLTVRIALPDKTLYPPDEYATKWHEYDHVWQSYQDCFAPTNQKLDINALEDYTWFWALYFQYAAREYLSPNQTVEQQKSSQQKIDQYKSNFGIDWPALVHEVFFPNKLNQNSELWKQCNQLKSRFILVSIYEKRKTIFTSRDLWVEDQRETVETAEKEWKEFLKHATLEEIKAIWEMQEKGIVAKDFFPTMPTELP